MPQVVYDISTYSTDAQCTKPFVMTIFKGSASCLATEACTEGANSTQCRVLDYRRAARTAFQAIPYVLIERFDDDACAKFSSAAVVPLDGRCYGLAFRGTFFTAELASDKSITVKQFAGVDCSAKPNAVLVATVEQREQFACLEGRLLTTVSASASVTDKPSASAVPDTTQVPSPAPSASQAKQASNATESSYSTTMIVALVLGAALIAVALAAFFKRQSKLNRDTQTQPTTHTQDTTGDYSNPRSPPAFRPPNTGDAFFARDHDLKMYRRPAEEIQNERVIGAGAFCIVWRVRIRDSIAVASKRLKTDNPSQDQIVQFIEEIKLSAKLTHPRVVEFIGVAWTNDKDLQALFEYMENGTLRSWLRKHRNSEITSWSEDKLQIAIDVAEALAYTHSFVPPLIHRDLKSSNVLLTISLRAKLSDFGIARFKSYENTMTAGAGTTLWLSPEVIAGRRDYDQRTDVFSFGVLLSELDTHELPYFDARDGNGERMLDIMVAKKIVDDHLTPTFLPSCPKPVLELAQRCLSFNPRDRPAADEVLFKLHQVKQDHF